MKNPFKIFSALVLLFFVVAGDAFSKTGTLSVAMPPIAIKGFPEIEVIRLNNGLRVMLWPDAAASRVSVHVWYSVGALHETKGLTGIAHLFEHMMFRPSRFAPQGGLALGPVYAAEMNATTKYKTTNYYMVLPNESLEKALEFEADVMRNLPLDAAKLTAEKEAVRSEYLNWDNTAAMVLLPHLTKAMYGDHIAGSFITGERADLDKITIDDCKNFYDSYYAPNNATLVITGGFNRDATLALVEKYFGSLKPGVLAKLPADPSPPKNAQTKDIPVPGEGHLLAVSYPIPFAMPSPEENNALQLALYTLFGGKRSLVGKKLIDDLKVAESVSLDYEGLGFPFVFVNMTGSHKDKVVAGIDTAAKALQDLDRPRFQAYATSFQADTLRRLQSPQQRSFDVGFYLNYRGGLEALKANLAAPSAISLDSVKNVARKYLTENRRYAIYGKPQEKK